MTVTTNVLLAHVRISRLKARKPRTVFNETVFYVYIYCSDFTATRARVEERRRKKIKMKKNQVKKNNLRTDSIVFTGDVYGLGRRVRIH